MQDRFQLEPDGSNDGGPCPCCGHTIRCVWGRIRWDGVPAAVYFARWTLGRVREHGAAFDFIIGEWGEGTDASQRQAVSLSYRLLDSGPGVTVIDADGPEIVENPLVGHALRRSQVVGTPFADVAFALFDGVLLKDHRLRELHGLPPQESAPGLPPVI